MGRSRGPSKRKQKKPWCADFDTMRCGGIDSETHVGSCVGNFVESVSFRAACLFPGFSFNSFGIRVRTFDIPGASIWCDVFFENSCFIDA